jgi:hypothetical protein
MKRVKVRCWKFRAPRAGAQAFDEVFASYPDSGHGHTLGTCLTCGTIFAVTIPLELYAGTPLVERLQLVDRS